MALQPTESTCTSLLGTCCFCARRKKRILIFCCLLLPYFFYWLMLTDRIQEIVKPATVTDVHYTYSFTTSSTEFYSLNFTFVFEGKTICHNGNNPPPIIVFLILSEWKNKAVRDGIRKSWASGGYVDDLPKEYSGYSTWGHVYKHAFLMGVPKDLDEREKSYVALIKENDEHKDIIVADFVDSYYNLTLKVLTGYRWARMHCSRTKYLAKSDHDVFIHVPRYLNLITDSRWDTSIFGPLHSGGLDRVERKGKFAVPRNALGVDHWPDHVKGNIYSMPYATAMGILRASTRTPYISVEDTYITGVLANIVNATHRGFDNSLQYSEGAA